MDTTSAIAPGQTIATWQNGRETAEPNCLVAQKLKDLGAFHCHILNAVYTCDENGAKVPRGSDAANGH